jgi:predicted phage terminase large subunit-like protein
VLEEILNKEIEYLRISRIKGDRLNYYKRDLFEFAKEMLGYKSLSENIHKPWAENMQEKNIKRRLRLKPRGTYKTSLYTISYPLWRLVNDPDIRIAVCSGNLENAVNSLQNIKRHIMYNQNFTDLFGNLYDKDLPWTQTGFMIKGRKDYNKKENSLTAIGFGTQMTGKHFDLIIADDIVNNDDRESPTIRKKKQRWFEDLISILEPDGEVLIVGTRWHFDDFYNYLINDLNIRLPEKERYDIEIETAINESGEANFPGILSLEKLESLKLEKGLVEFNSQYLNSPIASGTQIFCEEDFKYFNPGDINKDISCIAYLDPSMGKNYESDYSALITGFVDTEKCLNIIDALIVKTLPDSLFELVFSTCRKYNIKILGIESNNFQEYFASELSKRSGELNLRIEKIKNYTNKEIRIQSIQPAVKNGKIRFRSDMQKYYPLLREQLILYPLAKNDDAPDALEGLYSLSQKMTYKPFTLDDTKEETKRFFSGDRISRMW